jgi:ribose transport system permease protein
MLLGQQKEEITEERVKSYKSSLINFLRKLPSITYILVALIVIFYILNKDFLSPMNISNIIRQGAPLVIVSLGMLIVIMGGGIDLSVGALMALTGTIIALSTNAGLSLPIALILGVLVSTTCGLVSGLLIGMAGLPPMIVTFGMMYIAQGINLGITGGGSMTITSEALSYFGRGAEFLKIPAVLWVVILFISLVALLLNRTFFGGYLYAIGTDQAGAKAMGIKVNICVLLKYIISGFLAGVGGIILASRLLTGNALIGIGTEFKAIASVVVGGTPIIGGSGTLIGTIIGALIITILENALSLFGIYSGSMAIIIGVSLVIMVILSQVLYRRGKIGELS